MRTVANKEICLILKNIIENVSTEYDKIWRKRARKIDSKFLINFIFQLVLNSKKGYGIILSELWDDYLSKNIKTPQKEVYSISSICESRQKLPEEIFKAINEKLLKVFKDIEHISSLKNHRVFAIDGSKVSLKKRLEQENYKKFNQSAYYPSGLLSCLYNVDTHLIHDFNFTKSFSERDRALEHIEKLEPHDVVIFDRGYFSYLLLRKITDKEAHGLFRMQKNLRNKELAKFLNSDKIDGVIDYIPSKAVQYELKKIGHHIDFSPIKLRVLKQEIEGVVYIFATTLIGSEYEADIFGNLYHKRWDIEELYKVSKVLFNIEELHSKKERGVKQEIYAQFVLINIARFFEMRVNHDNKCTNTKLNFKGCILGLSRYINDIIFSVYRDVVGIADKIFKFISKMRYKVRPRRKHPRVSYKPRKEWGVGRNTIIKTS